MRSVSPWWVWPALIIAALVVTLIAPRLLGGSVAGDEFYVTAAELQRQITVEGPRAVLMRLTENNDTGLNYVCHQIESGNTAWLQVARSLRRGSDAAGTLSLNYAVARALPVRPVDVLKPVGQGFSVDDICTSPFIEPDPGIAEAYQRRALAALQGSIPRNLESVRAEYFTRITACP